MRFALVTDLHFGPEAHFEGKLRKLTHKAPILTDEVISRLRESPPDLLVNLGDDIEDESREVDWARYEDCQARLRALGVPLLNVAGNHDTVHLGRDAILSAWGRTGHLYYSEDLHGVHWVVLHTQERKDVDIRIPEAQRAWLTEDLARTDLPTVILMHHSASEQDLDDSRWFRGRPHIALVKERQELRRIFEHSGKVRAVFNGHLHRNHLDVIRGIPYITVQSLIENLDEDAPGRPAAAYAIAELSPERLVVRVRGQDPARYQVEFSV